MLKVMIDMTCAMSGSNSEAIQHIKLKLTMGECLNRHYVGTKFHPNLLGSGNFCVDLTSPM